MTTIGAGAWIRATWLGWILGLPILIGLALLGEAVGVGGVQFIVGLGMGAGVGLMQARALRGVIASPPAWFKATCLGLAAPFALADIATRVIGLPFSLPVAVAAGGLLAGVLQARLLTNEPRARRRWEIGSGVGWLLGAGTSGVAGLIGLRGVPGLLLYLATIALGGAILGAITSRCVPRSGETSILSGTPPAPEAPHGPR